MKHPIAWAFVAAFLICVILAIVMPYTTQESPWALGAIVLAFPFIWFFAWLVTNAFAWWKDNMK